MVPNKSTIQNHFFQHGLTYAMVAWLLFYQSLTKSNWQNDLQALAHETNTHSEELLSHWLQRQAGFELLHALKTHWLAPGIGGVFGLLAMLGALSYSGQHPVNLWLVLGLFVFLPFIATFTTIVAWHHSLNSLNKPLPVFGRLILKKVSISSHVNSLRPWLMWKFQWMAVSFQISAIVTFLIILLFQDLAFSWSSTLIKDGAIMAQIIQGMAAPWQWFIEAPSISLIEASQYYRSSETFNPEQLGQWWPFILMAMVIYGLLPRLMLFFWMRFRVRQFLRSEIELSGKLEKFIYACSETITQDSDSLEADCNIVDMPETKSIAWQWQPDTLPSHTSLGLSTWEQDEKWIENNLGEIPTPVYFSVQIRQTPTAELTDVIDTARKKNADLQIGLLTIYNDKDDLESGSFKSWQLFATKHQLLFSVADSNGTPYLPEEQAGGTA